MRMTISGHERSKKVIMTNEARILRKLRVDSGLSLREVGRRLGKCHALIAQIEGGRLDVPRDEKLMKILEVYGIDNYKSFYDRVRNFSDHATPSEQLAEIAKRLAPERIDLILQIAKRIAEGKAVIAL